MAGEKTDTGKVRTNEELRAGIDEGVSDVRKMMADSAAGAQDGMGTYGQMRELVGRHELTGLQNSQKAEEAVASALAIAMSPENKGRLPSVVTDYLNRQFGFDGKTTGIIDGGIDPKTGEFGFVFGERDNAGNTQLRKQMIPSQVQLGLMEGYPSLFGEDTVKAHREKLLERFAPAEVDAYSRVAKLARDRRTARINELKMGDMTYGRAAGRNLFRSRGVQDGGDDGSIKETVSALTQMQTYLDKAGPTMSDEQRQKIQQALDAGFSGLAARFMPKQPGNPTAEGGAQAQENGGFPEGMKEGDEREHNGKKYVLGLKDGKPMWMLKK